MTCQSCQCANCCSLQELPSLLSYSRSFCLTHRKKQAGEERQSLNHLTVNMQIVTFTDNWSITLSRGLLRGFPLLKPFLKTFCSWLDSSGAWPRSDMAVLASFEEHCKWMLLQGHQRNWPIRFSFESVGDLGRGSAGTEGLLRWIVG